MRRRLFSIAAGKTSVKTDSLFNIPNSILSKINSNLYLTENHPLNKLKNRIEARFPTYSKIDNLSNPIVSVQRNFNDLLIPSDHPGRLPSDTYYFNKDTVLRTHTSAHQSDILSSKLNNKYLITADVYRRDEIDPTHYPVFHQMEGIHTFSRSNLALEIKDDAVVDESDIKLKIVDETGDGVIQTNHSIEESQMVSNHMKKTLESLIKNLFSREKELEIRWIEAYFPFTSPSWEMEVFYDGKWLEVFGCGVIQQEILDSNSILMLI